MVEGAAVESPWGSHPARAAEKALVRARMVERLKAISPAERRERSLRASRSLLRTLETNVPAGAPVALFAPTPTELSCEPALALLEGRHPMAFPRVDGGALQFQLAPFAALAAHTSKVREPAPDAPRVKPVAIVLPGRAFDRTGLRLGRGAGFYDRTLAALGRETLLVGFVYAFQVVDELPREPYDRAVQLIVTDEGGPLRCRQTAAP